MKFTVGWLKEYYDFDDINLSDRLISRGLEIDEQTSPINLNKFKLVKITKIDKHPNADKLNICLVSTYNNKTYEIVCGAENLYVGMVALLATVGAKIPKTKLILEKAVIRDVESCGMLCSAEEMCLGESDGILDLHVDLDSKLDDLFNDGEIIDIEVTANRKDVLNIFGLSREISAGFRNNQNRVIKKYDFTEKQCNNKQNSGIMFANVSGFKTTYTPLFMTNRLASVGIKVSVNLLDNIINYVNHAFGYNIYISDKTEEAILVNEKLGHENKVEIESDKYGFNVCVSALHNTVTSKYSDASNLELAMSDLLSLLESYGCKVEYCHKYFTKQNKKEVTLEFAEAIDISGYNYTSEKIKEALVNLDFKVIEFNDKLIKVEVPSWRVDDIQDSCCLIEEVMRYHGINNITTTPLNPREANFTFSKDLYYKNFWIQKGLYEVFNNSFMDSKDAQDFSNCISINNPMTSKQAFLRNSLIPGLLNLASKYLRYNWQCDGIFEIGNIFENGMQKYNLGCIWINKLNDWTKEQKTFFSCKKDVEDFLTLNQISYDSQININNGCAWMLGKEKICSLNEIEHHIAKKFKIKEKVFICEMSLNIKQKSDKVSKIISTHNVIHKDLSFKVPANFDLSKITEHIISKKFDKTITVKVFDIHPDLSLSKEKSVGIRLIWEQLDKTQTAEELDDKCKELIHIVEEIGCKYAR